MTGDPEEVPRQPAAPAGLNGTDGAIVAGRDVIASSTHYTKAKQAFILPPEAYAPIPDDAVDGEVSNIGTRLFVGRAKQLSALHEAFARPGEGVVHTVHGLGGVGKSALAAHWAARRPEKVRWWIAADTADEVNAGVALLAQALQPGLVGLPVELQTERAVAWLAGHDGWLLVLDNVEDPRHIRPILDRLPGGRVLVTTRRSTGWHHDATAIRLGVLDPDDAVDLFTHILTHHDPRDTDGAHAVCEELGHLALAIEQAAAYCAETGTDPHGYLDMLAQWPATMFATSTVDGYPERTIARIWHLTLDRLADTPLAGDLLRILAWYAPDSIPRSLLQSFAEPPHLATAIGQLTAYSMITNNHDGTLSVHRLVQALARTPDPHDPQRQPVAIDHARDQATVRLAEELPLGGFDQPETWPRCRELLPHADALTRHHTPDQDTIETAIVLNRAGVYRLGQGASTLATRDLQRALAIDERVLGRDHLDTLASGNNLAYAYRDMGDLDRAIPLFERSLQDCERVLGKDSSLTLISRSNLADTYKEAGNPGRAIPLLERALQDCERVLSADHTYTLASRYSLAIAYRDIGDLDRAIPLHEHTLREHERVLGENHPHSLSSRYSLTYTYQAAGDLDRAIPLYERTLQDYERVLSPDHPSTLGLRSSLGSAYQAAGDLGRAIPLYERTLQDCERVLSPDHPSTLAARSYLASAYRDTGDLGRAIPLYERTLQDCERVLSPDHPDTLAARNNLAYIYRIGNPGRAIQLCERNLRECERVLSPDHPRMLVARNNLAGAYQAAGDLDRAIPLLERNLRDRERVLSPDHPDTLAARNNLAGAYQTAGDLDRAIPLYERTLQDCERVLSPGHSITAMVWENLEWARRAQRTGRAR